MRWTEDDLRRAMRRTEPGVLFAARVMALLDEEPAAPAVPWYLAARPWWRAAVAVVCLLVLSVGVLRFEQERRQRRQAEAARDQLMMALQLTAGKLKMTRARIVNLSYEQRPESDGREGRVE